MSRALTVAEAQADLEHVVQGVERGEVVPLTRQGQVIAEIRPVRGRSRLGRMMGSVTFLDDVIEPIDVAWGESA